MALSDKTGRFQKALLDPLTKTITGPNIIAFLGIALLFRLNFDDCLAWPPCPYLSFGDLLVSLAMIATGWLWARTVRFYQNRLSDAGISQEWTSEEPDEPRDAFGTPAPGMRLLGYIGDFTAYDYLISRGPLDMGESHVQCNICHRWSIFPLMHIDGEKYAERQLNIHRAICHPTLEKDREKFREDYVGPFEKRYDEASTDVIVAMRVLGALKENSPEAVGAEQEYKKANEAQSQAYDEYRASLDAVFRALNEGLKSVPDTYFHEALETVKQKQSRQSAPPTDASTEL